MNAVRELGCAFSLDDFGVGFSSFNYIKQLPVDYVKIDGSFVRTLVDSPDDQVFVRALAEVARGFGKKTVAEFVEDERALNMLRSFGVDYAQGYFIGKPDPEIA
jgi:EAL domain-containing protein (putative c-di-GMP-specific phosphodiesterase class I)